MGSPLKIADLRRMINKMKIVDENCYKCDQCAYVTNQRNDLVAHKVSTHKGARHRCNLCSFSSIGKSKLNIHVINKHQVLNLYCNKCEYRTTQEDKLKEHTLVEHVERKFQQEDKDVKVGETDVSGDFMKECQDTLNTLKDVIDIDQSNETLDTLKDLIVINQSNEKEY